MTVRSWVQHPVTLELIPKDEYHYNLDAGGVYVQPDIQPFISPIDGSVITGRRSMADHCKKHGVVPAQEFDDAHYARKAAERADIYNGTQHTAVGRRANQERIEAIKATLEKYGV